MPSSSAFRSRMATRVSRSGGWRRHSRRRALPVERREVAVGAVRLPRPLDAEGADQVAEGGREVQALVGGVEGVVDDDALARRRHAVDADDALVEQAVDSDADRLALLDERDGVTLDTAEVGQHW